MTGKRIFVSGYSGAGKSTYSDKLSKKLNIPVIHCDDFIDNSDKNNWSEMPHIIIEKIMDKDNYILDGVVVSRVVRKIKELDLDIRPTEYYFLTDLFRETTKKQDSMNKGILTIHKQIEPILEDWGVEIIYDLPEDI